MTRRTSARLGLLVPFTNTNLEPDFALMCPPDVSIYTSRLGGYDADEIPDEGQMQGLGASDLSEPLGLLMGVAPDVVIYGCTSATLSHGPSFDRDLAARITAMGGAKTVTAAGALVHAIKHLRVRRIGFASPYVAAINDLAVSFLQEMGIETVARGEAPTALSNEAQGALTPEDVLALARQADRAEAEALLLSCTDMRSVEIIATLEAETGKPVITSNQAMMFQAMQLLDMPMPNGGFGRLMIGR